MTTYRSSTASASIILVALLTGPGCETPPSTSPPSVTSAVRERDGLPPPGVSISNPPVEEKRPRGATMATVNGRPVAASQVVDLLLRSHGPGILEQLVALYAAEDLAKTKGLTVGEKDVDHEFELALRRLAQPLASLNSGSFDRAEPERILESVLSERNISREEFFLPLRRNAYLRKIAQADLTVSEEQLRAEYDRRYGERVQVRHIQLTSSAEASRMQERLAAGEDFADLATRYSANAASRKNGGLIDSMSATDEELPDNFRRAAFALQPGQISGVIRVGEWYHVLKMEKRIPAESPDFASVKDELTRAVQDRVVEARMRELYEQSLTQAALEVHDPALREAYQRRVQRRGP